MGTAAEENTWSYEPVQATIETDGRRFDVQIPARHPLVSSGKRPVRGTVFGMDYNSAPDSSLDGSPRPAAVADVAGNESRMARRRRSPRRRPDHRGRVTVIRRPAPVRPGTAPLEADVTIPVVPKDPIPVPWGTMIPSLAGGAIIAYLFSPMFAILAGVTAVGMLGRSVASYFTHRRKTAARAEALHNAAVHIEVARSLWSASEAERRTHLDSVVLGLLRGGLREGMMPWSRRMSGDGSLDVCLGTGWQSATPVLSGALASDLAEVPGLKKLASSPLQLPHAPVYCSITSSGGLAVSGDRGPAMDLARQVVVSQQIEYGPADLGVAVLTTQDRLSDWDWVKWLPSFVGAAICAEEVEALLEPLCQKDKPSHLQQLDAVRPVLLVVDGVEPTGPGAFAQAFAGRVPSVRLLSIVEALEAPAACSTLVEARADASFVARSLLDPTEPSRRGTMRMLPANEVGDVARILAPLDDPELDDAGLSLPGRVSHEALYAEDNWRSVLESRWEFAQRTQLTSTLGLDRNGPVSLDLVADGPHMLAAGTTGSGKSEMLRSLIVGAAINQPPDQVSFLLVDFKGGGAFDLVSGLPHVAAVVTDLDPGESGRALRSLQSEMRSREEVLRANECSDIADLRGDASLPRLVIVVDEFASLADELPEFLDGLIDVARRGRSLGVHLVLATQRPAGVVTGQIRANTNLRVCLRVQDQADSMDVLDGPEAAHLPAVPGRAIVSRGGSKPSSIQCVKVEADDANALTPFVIHPGMVSANHESVGRPDSENDDPMVDLVAACFELVPTRNSAPWLDPIHDVDLDEVRESLVERGRIGEVAMGWLDDPDNRARVPFGWAPERGALALIGSDGDALETSVRTSIAGLVAKRATHVYVLDGSGTLGNLESLPCIGSVVGINEPERAAKLLAHVGSQLGASGSDRSAPTIGLVVHRWGAVVDVLESVNGAMAGAELQKLLRDGADRGLATVISASSDREVPNRVMSSVGQRVVHRLADPSGYLSFGISRHDATASLDGQCFIDVTTMLAGLIASAEPVDLGIDESGADTTAAPTIRVLGDRVGRTELPVPVVTDRVVLAPLGLGSDLEAVSISLRPGQPTIVVGRSGSGRTTAIETLIGRLGDEAASRVEVFDDAELIDADVARKRLDEAKRKGRAVIIGAKPAMTRGIGSWLAPLMSEATVVLINPSKADSDACRILAPDLAGAARGRAVVSDGSATTLVQIAA